MGNTTSSSPNAIDVPKRVTSWKPTITVRTHPDGSTEEGAAYRGPSNPMVEEFTSFTRILSEAGVGPVIAWGEIAMIFHGIPTAYLSSHVLIPDCKFEDARKALLADGYIDVGLTDVPWSDLGAPWCEMRDSKYPDRFLPLFLLGLSAVQPMFENIDDITGFKETGGIAFPPLLTLALSFLHALSRSKVDTMKGLALSSLLACWCGYTQYYGYSPLGCDAMEGQLLDKKLMSHWVTGSLVDLE